MRVQTLLICDDYTMVINRQLVLNIVSFVFSFETILIRKYIQLSNMQKQITLLVSYDYTSFKWTVPLLTLKIKPCRLTLALAVDFFKGRDNRMNHKADRVKWQAFIFKIARVHNLLERSLTQIHMQFFSRARLSNYSVTRLVQYTLYIIHTIDYVSVICVYSLFWKACCVSHWKNMYFVFQ